MAAAVTERAAALSQEQWAEAGGAAAEARALRGRVAPLAQADARAYEEARRALASARGDSAEKTDLDLGKALDFAASVPLAIAEAGAEVASLAAFVSDKGDPDVQGDANAAALLADAGTRAAAKLVEINLATRAEDPRRARARELIQVASQAVQDAAP
jgi:formiminotetrahydrofolate cyclodeaminase